jgi:hypothetical protein
MELAEFLTQTHEQVRTEIGDRLQDPEGHYPFPETVFAEIVMQHMAEIGMTEDPVVCHYSGKVGNANLRLTGYSVSEDGDALDLFVSLYDGGSELRSIPDSETRAAAEQCLRFLGRCAEGKLSPALDVTNDVHPFAVTIEGCYATLEQIRVFVLTDRQAKARSFKPQSIQGKTIKLEVMDIERLHRHWSEGKPRDELVVNFEEMSGTALPCIFVPGELADYDYAMTVIPAETLRALYEKFGPRLLEANVRSFLSATGKVNRGIRDTLRDAPEHFMAYNNGIVIVADEARLATAADGSTGLAWLRGMQIVNGGQTTASIYFAKRKSADIDLSRVRVPAKVIILQSDDPVSEEQLISDISRFANSQNAVKMSDLSANKPFHIQLEKLATATYCPDGVGRWFYERAAGSYNVLLAREGTTPAKLRQLRDAIPPARKISKTDLAKYLNAWDGIPEVVSLGSQKNFDRFMATLDEMGTTATDLLDPTAFKRIIAKAIIFRTAQRIIRPRFSAWQANITAYVVALLANRLGDRVNLDVIWQQQDLSNELRTLIADWSVEVDRQLQRSSGPRMVSEHAKKQECWDDVRSGEYPDLTANIPELR